MATTSQKPELLVIVGPTASGKSDLALKIALEFNGEIIAADSRTIYKGMDIGTAKPSKEVQEKVQHWGLDLVEPGEVFSAYDFKKYADQKIVEIQKRGNLPILVGGTGLYIDSVLFDFGFVDKAGDKQRAELDRHSVIQLQNLVKERGFKLPENPQNRRHLIRTIEREGKIGVSRSLKDNIVIIGLMPPIDYLKERINERAESYFSAGLLAESKGLLNKYTEESLNNTHGIAYIASSRLLKNEITKVEAIKLIRKLEWQYARRQRTWFRRNKIIRWFDSCDLAYKEIVRILNN
jgi:tRNA dimethylallyltransferase